MAGARRREGFCSRKTRVQELNTFIKLLGPTGLKVLKRFHAGNYASQIAASLGCTRGNITYWKKKLLHLGLIRLQTDDVFKIYSLTPLGLKVLTRSEEKAVPVETVVLEDHAVKFLVVEHEKERIDWRKLGEPKNWEKLGVKIGGVRVVKTSKSVIIHPGKLRGWDVDELLVDAGRTVQWVKSILELKFGMVLSDVGFPLHKPVFRFYTDEAKEIVAKEGTTIVEDVGSVDKSPPERIAHEEYYGKRLGKERLLFPFTLKRLEEKVDALNDNVLKLVDSMQKFTETFSKLLEPQPAAPNNLEKKVDYVA